MTTISLPHTLEEAISLLGDQGGDTTILAGGTILMGLINEGLRFPRQVLSLARVGLDRLTITPDATVIGAAVTLARLARDLDLPLLSEAAALAGGPALRTTATIGGNLFASPPYGDLIVALLALDASVELAGAAGRRALPIEVFLAERAVRAPASEILTEIYVPRMVGRAAYTKMMRRAANSPAVVVVAVRLTIDATGVCTAARIALGNAASQPFRAMAAEAALVGTTVDAEAIAAASNAAMEASDPPTDALATAWYRRRMVGVQVRRTLARAMKEE
jgi:CO/xanthine dehydrogenase FAD-binding subunit